MKDILRLHVKYNQQANKAMMESLKKITEADFKKDVGIYFKSIEGLFEHSLGVDAMLFGNVFSKYANKPMNTQGISAIANPDMSVSSDVKSSMANLFAAREKVDAFIVELVENIDDFSKIEVLEFPGVKFQKPIYHFVISILTHDTHHRGQIAAALDILGVENDFNGMLMV